MVVVIFFEELLTLDDGKQDNDDEKEEGNIKHDSVNLVIVTIWWFDFITNTTTCSYAFVQMEDEALQQKR